MTFHDIELLGHFMHLSSDGDVLTGCRWFPADRFGNVDNTENEDKAENILNQAIVEITEYLEGKRKVFDVPVKAIGTDFQMKVWDELRRIPYGETMTYAELARRIGHPKAYRAVANACGANPLPIIIPCHRVVGSNGKPGGYTGGLDIKQVLLRIEAQHLN